MDLSGVGQGLYDKNIGKLYAPAQLLPYEEKHKRKTRNTRRMDDKRQEIVVQYKRMCHEITKKKRACLFMSQNGVTLRCSLELCRVW